MILIMILIKMTIMRMMTLIDLKNVMIETMLIMMTILTIVLQWLQLQPQCLAL